VLAMSSWLNDFPLLDQIRTASPTHVHPDGHGSGIYKLDDIDPGSTARYVYFAASVVWRAGSTSWSKARVELPRCPLGPYESELRDYLLDAAVLPADVFVMMWVIESDLRMMIIPPLSKKYGAPSYTRHSFQIPGIMFQLFIGKGVPADIRGTALSAAGTVFVGGFESSKLARDIVENVRTSPSKGKLRRSSQ
jgi:hypothetical protein